jgi:hypothetical protein
MMQDPSNSAENTCPALIRLFAAVVVLERA